MNIHEVQPDPELEQRAADEREEFEGGHVRPFVLELASRGSVTAEEWAVRMNGYERDLLLPHLQTEVFLQQFEHVLANCSRREGVSYDDAAIRDYGPEAIRRMRDAGQAILSQERQWTSCQAKASELMLRMEELGRQLRALSKAASLVLEWCRSTTLEEPGPFSRVSYADGLKHAKRSVSRLIVGAIGSPTVTQHEPDGSEYPSIGRGVVFRLLGDVFEMLQHELRVVYDPEVRHATEDGQKLTDLIHRVAGVRKAMVREAFDSEAHEGVES